MDTFLNGDFFKDLDECPNPFNLNDDYTAGISLIEPERISPITSLSESEFNGFIDNVSMEKKHDVTEYVNYVTNEQIKLNEGNGCGSLSDSGMSSDNNMDM